jgi:MarR family transcriptional regulator, transcriptional regulator for hemolysin
MAPSRANIRSEIGFLIARVSRLLRREADQAFAAHGLSQASAIPLIVLSRLGKCVRQGALADEVGIEGPSLVRLIDLLQAEGLVERREDPTDRRAKMLHLTAQGETRADEIHEVLGSVRACYLTGIADKDLAVAYEVLRKIELRAGRLLEDAVASETA